MLEIGRHHRFKSVGEIIVATLTTHCVGYQRYNKIIKEDRIIGEIKTKFCECGSIINKRSSKCRICFKKSIRKVNRPEYDDLINDINLFGYKGTGIKYGVSDNSIRKWVKNYRNKL